jgi:glycosyltransferase involved in cell wall biosynthesis
MTAIGQTSVSFIIPAFNCVDTIGATMDSIFDGNYRPGDEVIVVNDCSTDNTADMLEQCRQKYPVVKVLNHKVNKGTAAAGRNTGIEQASNPLIFCLDADNILCPGSVPVLKEYMLRQSADAAAFRELHFFRESINNVTHKWVFRNEISLADALSGSIWPGPSGNYLFTRDSWLKAGRYFEPTLENQTIDSWAFGIRQLATGSRMTTLPDTYYLHRYGHSSHFIRNTAVGNVSLAALEILLPFLNLLEDKDVEFIFDKRNRCNWFAKMEERPIRVKGGKVGRSGFVVTTSLYQEAETLKTGDVNNIFISISQKLIKWKKNFFPQKWY